MDGVLRSPDAVERGRAGSIGVPLAALRTRYSRGGDDEDMTWRERWPPAGPMIKRGHASMLLTAAMRKGGVRRVGRGEYAAT